MIRRIPIVLTFVVLALSACVQQPPPEAADPDRVNIEVQAATELFFSEYVEGSSVNKALEIFNGTPASVDLAAGGYSLEIYFNGSATAGTTISLAGVVASGDVYVVADDGADAAILAQSDQTSTSNFFNGDDAIVLRKAGVVVDSIGQIGFDPGSQWGAGDASTQDNTLRRKAAICTGDTDPTDAFDPGLEWDGFSQDTFGDLGAHAGCGAGPGPVEPVINEFVANHTGTDDREFVEILGSPSTPYDALTLLEIEGDGNAPGTIDGVFPLGTTDADGYWTTGFLTNELENGSITLLLVEGFTGSAGDDLDADDDGVLDATPWTGILDGVSVEDGDAGDRPYSETVLTEGFDGVSFTPGGASRIPDGADTDATSDWARNDFDLFGIDGASGTPELGEAVNTPGAVNRLVDVDDTVQLGICGAEATPIHAVQGAGFASPLDGELVVIEGVVVGDFQAGDGDFFGTDLDGFHVQEEVADWDGDPASSEGIFVFDPDAPDVSVGDIVRVRGSVDEFFGRTEITDVTDAVECGAEATPAPTTPLSLPLTDAEREAVEGMLVVLEQELAISEYFNFDRFGEIVLALPNPDTRDRQFTPTSFVEPGSAANAEAQENELSRITLDDGRSSQNPDPARHPNGAEFDLDNRFRGGDVVTDAIGVMDYSFGLYRIQPTGPATYLSTNPRPTTHEAVGGDLTVATFNVLNYFLTLDEGPEICGPDLSQECRGADTAGEFERQRAKILAALTAIEADVYGLIEMENTTGVEPLADLVSGLNDVFGAGTYDYIDTGTIGTDAIRVGFLYKATTVTPVGSHAILDSTVDSRFLDEYNRPVLAQTFAQNSDGAIFTAAVNHLKSKGSACDAVGDPDLGDGQGNCNLTREAAAEAMVDWLATDPTGSGDSDVLILGDLNSYDEEDPIDVLKAAGFADLGEAYQGEFAYTYVFDGQFGHLDYAMASPSLELQVTGATNWHINADEPDLLDYDTSFKQDAQDALFEPDPFRSSDHDPVIVGLDLNLNVQPQCSRAEPSRATLWPPNHKMASIMILGATDPDGDDITITIDTIYQDEPVDVAGDSDGNTAPDGAGIGTDTAEVRAERIEGGNGRVYHVAFTATDELLATCSGTVRVDAPSSQGRNGAAVDDGALFDSTDAP